MSALQGVSSAVILTLKGSLWEPRHDLIDVPNAEQCRGGGCQILALEVGYVEPAIGQSTPITPIGSIAQ